jgi:hypothetical protein
MLFKDPNALKIKVTLAEIEPAGLATIDRASDLAA